MLSFIKRKLLSVLAHSVPREVRHNFQVDILAAVLSGIGLGFFTPYFAMLARDEFSANGFLLGLLTSGGYTGSMIALFSGGFVKSGREKYWYAWSNILARLLIVWAALSGAGLPYCGAVFLMNLMISVFSPQYSLLIRRIYPIEYRGRLMGCVRIAGAVSTIAGSGLSGLFMKNPDFWRVSFVIAGLMSAGAAALFFRMNTGNSDDAEPAPHMLKHLKGAFMTLRSSPRNLRLILVMPLYSFSTQILNIAAPIMQVDVLHVTKANMSVVAIVQFVMWTLGFYVWGRYIDRYSASGAFVLHIFAALLWPLFYFIADSWIYVILAQGAHGFIISCNEIGFFNMKLEITEKGKDAEYQAIHAFAGGLRCLAGVFVAVFLLNLAETCGVHIKYLFLAAACLLCTSGAALFPLAFGRNRIRKNGAG